MRRRFDGGLVPGEEPGVVRMDVESLLSTSLPGLHDSTSSFFLGTT